MFAGASIAAPPGDDAAWFWALDCASRCNRAIAGYEIEAWYGREAEGESRAYELGAGIAGVYPFAQGYVQLREGERPLGIGARVGIPLGSWHEHQLFVRYDIPLSGDVRLLVDPALFLHAGNSPNGENPGLFLGAIPAVGIAWSVGSLTFVPSAALVGGWVKRDNYGVETSSFTLFPTISLGIRP